MSRLITKRKDFSILVLVLALSLQGQAEAGSQEFNVSDGMSDVKAAKTNADNFAELSIRFSTFLMTCIFIVPSAEHSTQLYLFYLPTTQQQGI